MNLFLNWLASVALMLPAFLLVLSFHECAHAGMAFLLGDTTAKRQGRFTLNPLAHVDRMGLLFLLVFLSSMCHCLVSHLSDFSDIVSSMLACR